MHTLRSLCLALLTSLFLTVFSSGSEQTKTVEETFFRPPDFEKPSVSPAGKSVGFIARLDGRAKLYRLNLAAGKIEGLFDPGAGDILNFWWISETRLLIAGNGKDGVSHFIFDLATNRSTPVPSLRKAWSWELRTFQQPESTIIAAMWDSGSPKCYLTSIAPENGREKRIEGSPGSPVDVVTSATGEVRAQSWLQGSTWTVQWRASAKDTWHEIRGRDTLPTFYPVGMAADDRSILVIAYDQTVSPALMVLDPSADQRSLVTPPPLKAVAELIKPNGRENIIGVSFKTPSREDSSYLSPTLAARHEKLQRSLPKENTRIVSVSLDETTCVAANWNQSEPASYYLLTSGQLSLLGQEQTNWKSEAATSAFQFKTGDGTPLTGSLTTPPGSSPRPLIMMVTSVFDVESSTPEHFDAQAHFFASHGYAVARLSHRNPIGYLADEANRTTELDSLRACLSHLIAEKVTTEGSIILWGRQNNALLAFKIASVDPRVGAVIAENPGAQINANQRDWKSARQLTLPEIIKERSYLTTLNARRGEYDPARTIPMLSAKALLIFGDYPPADAEFYRAAEVALRNAFNRNKNASKFVRLAGLTPTRSEARYLSELNQAVRVFLDVEVKAK